MTTIATQKTPIQVTWTTDHIQAMAARTMAHNWCDTFMVLSKYGPEAIRDYERVSHFREADYYQQLGCRTPMELIRAIAEFETNVLGSKIEIWGDDNCASMSYTSCAIWNTLHEHGDMDEEHEEQLGVHFQNCVTGLAREFGFTGEVTFEETGATITIHK